jgi:two-component sensor histidine kinase
MTSDAQGRTERVSGVSIDISELREAEQRRTLLVNEVDHRARNVLAIVQSVIRMTKEQTIEAYKSTVAGRISALSIAHALLAASRWEGASLYRLVSEELGAYRNSDTDRVSIDGPPVVLRPDMAQSLALVLHELATNAAKYGALSDMGGRLSVTWEIQHDRLTLRWSEVGGPKVCAPGIKGYGTKLIHASILKQLGGTADFDWRPTGLAFLMSVPLAEGPPSGAADQVANERTGERVKDNSNCEAARGRVLLVEDEALVGLMMAELVSDMGFDVVGPYGRVAEAAEAIVGQPISAAILDINLGGELVYDLAEDLVGRGLPIVFVTGYGADMLDRRFSNIPVLQKPVDVAALKRVLEQAIKDQ